MMKRSVQIFGMAVVMMLAFSSTKACNHKHHAKHHGNKHHVKQGPPVWAPAHGYRAKRVHQFTYYPEHNIYYDQQRRVYVYVDMGHWRFGAELPYPLRNTNLSRSQSVVLELDADNPVADNAYHLKRYRKYSKKRYYATNDDRYTGRGR